MAAFRRFRQIEAFSVPYPEWNAGLRRELFSVGCFRQGRAAMSELTTWTMIGVGSRMGLRARLQAALGLRGGGSRLMMSARFLSMVARPIASHDSPSGRSRPWTMMAR